MALLTAGLALLALTGLLVRYAVKRAWHLLVIAALTVALFQFVANHLTGDVSRYLPDSAFSDGADGKDQIVLASAAATILVAISLAAIAWGAAQAGWRLIRAGIKEKK